MEIKEVKATAKLDLPKKVDTNLGKALYTFTSALKDITSTGSKVISLVFVDTPCTLFSPLSAYLKGKSYEIACNYLPFQEKIENRKEISQIKLAKAVIENLAEKENNGEKIPDKIEDTDTLFSIQNAASEISDEEFIKFWAHLYTEEVCKPNAISKRTIELCKSLDKNIVNILENKIFPFCDECGFFLGDRDKYIEDLILATDYDFIKTAQHQINPKFINKFCSLNIGQYQILLFPGYFYNLGSKANVLTVPAMEVKDAIKFNVNIKIEDILPQLQENALNWKIFDKFNNLIVYKKNFDSKFLITEKGKIIYPTVLTGQNLINFEQIVLQNIEFKTGAEKYFYRENNDG